MGSFDATCEICDEKKDIRIECECGICICEDCRDDYWIDNDNMCYECSNKEKNNKLEKDVNTE
jgi:hypothetical protein